MWESTKGKKPLLISYTVYDVTHSSRVLRVLQVNSLCLLQSFYFKLRSMIPCCLCHLNFTVAVPEEELIQVRHFRSSLIWEIAEENKLMNFNFSYIYRCTFVCLPRRSQSQRLPWRLTKTRLKRSHQTSPSPKVCLVKLIYLWFWGSF